MNRYRNSSPKLKLEVTGSKECRWVLRTEDVTVPKTGMPFLVALANRCEMFDLILGKFLSIS
jgi:hypothetical protein